MYLCVGVCNSAVVGPINRKKWQHCLRRCPPIHVNVRVIISVEKYCEYFQRLIDVIMTFGQLLILTSRGFKLDVIMTFKNVLCYPGSQCLHVGACVYKQ